MRYAKLVDRIGGPGAEAWDIHYEALAAQRAGVDVILLSIGDPDLDTPPVVIDAAVDAMRSGDTHYPEIPGRAALREAVATHYRTRFGLAVDASNVLMAAGAQNGLFAVARCLLEAGDEIVVPDPMYVTYQATLEADGARVVPVPTAPEDGFRVDPAAIAARIGARTRAILLASPANPSGAVVSRADMQEIAAIARAHDLWLVVDEVYQSLIFEGEHVCAAALDGMAERTVLIGSLSKSHAMTGWRVGWIVGPAELIGHTERLALAMTYGLPGFVQAGALRAMEHHDVISSEMRAIFRRRRDLVVAALDSCPGLAIVPPPAGMFVLVDVRGTGLGSLAFAWRLLREAGVSVLDAAAFGRSADGFVRLSFAADEATLVEACRRITAFVATLEATRPEAPRRSQVVVIPAEPAPKPRAHRIEIEGLRKRFGPLEVLKGISLAAREGDVISLIGASGSGKSTLLRCINFLEVPDEGAIRVDGTEIRIGKDRIGRPYVIDPGQLRRVRTKLAMVFQSFNLWPHRTVLENLIEAPIHVLGRPRREAVEHAVALLDRVGLSDKRDAYPASLSGGQQQRVAIARALAVDPEVMLFDEPTSALDPELVGEVLRVIRSLAEEGRTMILVTHEMAFARDVATHVAFLHQGLIEEEGPPDEVFLRPRSHRCRQFVTAHTER